ncbi:hypothetical protein BJX63DRAFT_444343 [Aspergillus granulosus]|uniref:Uncharacterized protein n=1 Tax=Aspergillus granulosus TaxID=176169 RepID=A0ABR4H6L6_9EURO
MPESPTSTLNWDFTPVINLLRSPASRGGSQPTSDSSPDLPTPSLLSHQPAKHDVERSIIKNPPPDYTNISARRLGDFDSIWKVLGNSNLSPGPNESAAQPLNQSKQTRRTTNPIVILKRPLISDNSVGITPPTPRTPAKSIPVAKVPVTNSSDDGHVVCGKPDTHPQRHCYQDQTNNESSSLDSIAFGESDSPSIFDVPHSKPQHIISMIPPQLGFATAKTGPLETPPSSFDESDGFMSDSAKQLLSTTRLQPLLYKTAADQRVGLLTKLLSNFPDYADLLVRPGRSMKSRRPDISPLPIHVFVDMSNIMVGFHDTMKISRNIPVSTRIRRIPLAFQNFSLILERGRPTAKRVLVGSDRYAAINESEKLGYEANILDRVQKVKSPTPHQLRFHKNPRATLHNGGHWTKTNNAPEQRWVEQGVDEILHLKILESLVDVDEPATIVLATGDAAEAEFSGGFLKMVERALQRGWKVELFLELRTREHSFFALTMASYTPKDLYGGAIKAVIPEGWLDASDLRQIPDHQELFLSPTTLSNLIIEINERVSGETALSSLQSNPGVLGPNAAANSETIDKAAVLYHLNDLRDGDADALRIVIPPQPVSLAKLPGAKAYKGLVVMTSPERVRSGVPTSIGGAAAGSSSDGALGSSTSLHYLLVRLEEQETDVLVFFNVPHKEFDAKGDPRGLANEEKLASETVEGLVEQLEIVDWGLFGG